MSETTRHFRFMSLPREMQIEVANRMPMEDVKSLSLACKATRERMLPVLFAHFDAGRGTALDLPERVAFMPEAFEHVRSVRFRLYIISSGRSLNDISNARRSVQTQLGLIRLLPNLTKVHIHVTISTDLEAGPAESPVSYYQSIVQAVCDLPTRPEYTLHMHNMPAGGTVAYDLFSAIIAPLREARFTGLHLEKPLMPSQADAAANAGSETDDLFYQAFCHIAPKLRFLRLSVPRWLARRADPVNLPEIRTLDLEYSFSTQMPVPTDGLSCVSALLNACGDQLSSVRLSVAATVDQAGNEGRARLRSNLKRRSLRYLSISTRAYQYLGRELDALSAANLRISLRVPEDWQLLEETFRCMNPQHSELRSLELEWLFAGDIDPYTHAPIWPAYRKIRDLIPSHVLVSLEMEGAFFRDEVAPLLGHLSEAANDLVELDLNMPSRPFDLVSICKATEQIKLPRCTQLSICGFDPVPNNTQESVSNVLDLLLRLISAPALGHLSLSVDAVESGWLLGLCSALDSGSFPALRRISGEIILARGKGINSPIDRLLEARVRSFRRACERRKIDLEQIMVSQPDEEDDRSSSDASDW